MGVGAQEEEDIMSATQLQSVESSSSSPSPVPVRTVSVELATSRAFANNPNHHLWKNGRLWWIAFTLIHDGWRQERVRQSLGTDNIKEARRRRDSILALFGKPPIEACLDPEGLEPPEQDFTQYAHAIHG
jgi:hypothetical protein